MVTLNINGQQVSVPEKTTIMEAAEKIGIHIPHLCFLKDINEIGACRVCLVEVEGMDKLVPACDTECREGMEVVTNSPRLRKIRRINVELILSDHKSECTSCVKSGNCSLQALANDLGIIRSPFVENTAEKSRWDTKLPLIRDASKCIKCMRCIQICEKVQSLGVWDLRGTGHRTTVGTRDNLDFQEADCALCGQCITHCPVGALRERDDRDVLNDAIGDPEKVVIAQVAPAVRTAWGEQLGLPEEENTIGKLVCALKKIGIDYVFDTNYSADLTIMEEGSEFLYRLAHKDEHKWPMFTSCCPGWVRFAKTQYPDMIENLSTAKSPQQMFGAVAKTYIAHKLGIDPDKVFSVSIMPCVSKKYERTVPQVNYNDEGFDVDLVLTTRELDRFVRSDKIRPEDLIDMPFDDIFGEGSGAAVIFGTTGGVMEAALRSAYFLATGNNPEPDAFKDVRGNKGWREKTFDLDGTELRVAVASGLGNARNLIEAVRAGEAEYDFVEIMACPGGCVGGGGQPFKDGLELAEDRSRQLYELDRKNEIRFSHENSAVQLTYQEYLGEPMSEKAHHLLHTDLKGWDIEMVREDT
ncbi:MAG: [FeFe] hydrogenase, group A [Candidatus Fimisoma sp.]|nr:[FeFe] hydrogenase, group A [Bacillota bacterium]MDD7285725.1 [FeFe] hydrogenase, group A [Bacillota bacterium]MDY4748501.1 [FeFe] hydrogenase, group A [Candidatus Fimisoma sp.]